MTVHTGEGGAGRIVAGIDGSPSSLAALSWAARQAELTGAALHVVIAWEWPSSYGWVVAIPDDYDPGEDARKLLDAALADLRSRHDRLAITTEAVQGHPATVLVDASRDADLLVVGSRGHGEFAGMLLGSVSGHCTAHAHCPVLVWRGETGPA